MKNLVILSQKGGSGKTTIAVHMAVCASRHGLKTALIDIDPQSSAVLWNASRSEETKLSAAAATAAQTAGLLKKANAGGIDLVIVDTAPHSNAEAAIVARLADFILIPCRPARFDLEAITSTVQIARAAKVECAVVISAAPRGKLTDEARSNLVRRGIPVVPTVLRNRVAYSHAVIDGRSVHEYEPDGAAAGEIDDLYNHITRLCGIEPSKVLK